MKIAVCCKPVPDTRDITVQAGTIIYENAPLVLSDNDAQALEMAKRVKKQTGASLVALCVNHYGQIPVQLEREIFARGADEFVVVDASLIDKDVSAVDLLAAMIREAESDDLVICGAESGDFGSQMTGIQLGAVLGATTLNGIADISFEDDTFHVERWTELEVEEYEVAVPLVCIAMKAASSPEAPGLMDMAKAAKKSLSLLSPDELKVGDAALVAGYETLAIRDYSENTTDAQNSMFPVLMMLEMLRSGDNKKRKKIVLPADAHAAAVELIDALEREKAL